MAVVMLSEAMGSRYIINTLANRFRNIVAKCKESGDILDLANCRFGIDCAGILRESYKDVDYINTEDAALDKMLKNNCEAARQELEPYDLLDLSNVNSIEECIKLAKSIPANAKIYPDLNLTNIYQKTILILLILARPDVEFDINHCAAEIFSIIRNHWLNYNEKHDAYYELIPPNIAIRNRQANGLFGCNEYGFMVEDEFVKKRNVVPIEFGNAQIIGHGNTPDEWLPIIEFILNLFELKKNKERKPGKTIKDFLTFRED